MSGATGELRPVFDIRDENAKLRKRPLPLPKLHELWLWFSDAVELSSLFLDRFHYHFPLEEEDKIYYIQMPPELEGPHAGQAFRMLKMPEGCPLFPSTATKLLQELIAPVKKNTLACISNIVVKTTGEGEASNSAAATASLRTVRAELRRRDIKLDEDDTRFDAEADVLTMGIIWSKGKVRPDGLWGLQLVRCPLPIVFPRVRRALAVASGLARFTPNAPDVLHPFVEAMLRGELRPDISPASYIAAWQRVKEMAIPGDQARIFALPKSADEPTSVRTAANARGWAAELFVMREEDDFCESTVTFVHGRWGAGMRATKEDGGVMAHRSPEQAEALALWHAFRKLRYWTKDRRNVTWIVRQKTLRYLLHTPDEAEQAATEDAIRFAEFRLPDEEDISPAEAGKRARAIAEDKMIAAVAKRLRAAGVKREQVQWLRLGQCRWMRHATPIPEFDLPELYDPPRNVCTPIHPA